MTNLISIYFAKLNSICTIQILIFIHELFVEDKQTDQNNVICRMFWLFFYSNTVCQRYDTGFKKIYMIEGSCLTDNNRLEAQFIVLDWGIKLTMAYSFVVPAHQAT
jgi:hypothetical protein